VKVLSGKNFCKLLESHGWRLMRVRGSHRIYAREGSPARVSVPVHGNAPLKRGLQRHLTKLAEMDEGEDPPDPR